MRHHTKDKGDRGLGFVIADMLRAGIQPAMLLREHLPFDCIAIAQDGQMRRVSVKYRAAKAGKITVSLVSSWADKNGSHTKDADLSLIDVVAVFCPETSEVYYVRRDELIGQRFTLRIEGSKNGQTAGIRDAAMFTDAGRIFGTTKLLPIGRSLL